jgi:hypothetical protein
MGSEPIAGSYLAMLREISYPMSIKIFSPDGQNVKQKSSDKDFLQSFHHGFQGHEQLQLRTKFF